MTDVMNAAPENFQDIAESLVSHYGRDVLWEKRFASLLRDWKKGAFHEEAEFFLFALNSGLADRIRDIENIRRDELLNIANHFSAEYFIQNDKARAVAQLLMLLIHKKSIPLDDEWMYTQRRKEKPPGEHAPETGMVSFKESTFINWNGEVVSLSPYSIMRAPVTQAEYWAISGDNPSYTQGAALPVDGVRWYAAVDFCNKKSARDHITSAYTIDKLTPDPKNLSPADFFRWKVNRVPGAKGWRLPTAGEWEYAYKTSALFALNAGLQEWCWDFCGHLVHNTFYNNERVCFSFTKRGRVERSSEGAEGSGGCGNVTGKRTNYGKVCFSYAGNYGFRLARSGL
jgi:hypothetical protein